MTNHEFHSQNPGRVVTRYEFSQIFSKAWFSAMSASNILSSFKATGICPFNRHALDDNVVGEREKYTAFKPERLPMRTGLAYIPLYSPSRNDAVHRPHTVSSSSQQSLCSMSDSEISSAKFPHASCLFENSFNSTSPHGADTSVPIRRATSMSKFLIPPLPPNRITPKCSKSSGCVLTSQENLLRLAEKQKRQLEAAEKKEGRKREREERKLQREQQKL